MFFHQYLQRKWQGRETEASIKRETYQNLRYIVQYDCITSSLFLHVFCLGIALMSAALVTVPQQHPEENYSMIRI